MLRIDDRKRGVAPLALWLLLCGAIDARAEETPWLVAETAHAELYAQTSPERAAEIVESLELFRAVFERLAPGIELASPVPTSIFAFRDAEAYARYRTVAQGGGVRVLGQMVAHRDGNYMLIDAGAAPAEAMSVVFHEYVHYLVRHNFPRVPRWFNEGLAEYYSTFRVEGDRIVLGRPVERHLRWLARSELDLAEVLERPLETRRRHGPGEVGNFYAGSWALVHYLLSSDSEGAGRLGNLLAALAEGDDPRRALEDSFGVRLAELERAVGEYVVRGEFATASIGLDRLGPARAPALRVGHPGRVEAALARMSVHLGRSDVAAEHAERTAAAEIGAGYGVLALLREQAGRWEEAEILYRQAVEVGADDPTTYLDFARFLVQRDLPARAEAERPATLETIWKLLDVAQSLAPSFAEVDAVRGLSYLYAADVSPGLRAIERARRRLPDRMDIVFHEAQLWMKSARFDRAEQIIESVLARHAEEELVATAREELERSRLVHLANEALGEGDLDRGIELLDEAIDRTSDPALRERMEYQLIELQRKRHVR